MKRSCNLLLAISLIVTTLLSGCKPSANDEKAEKIVKVKIMKVGSSWGADTQTYSGTIEECDGISLSFTAGGTITQMLVTPGQSVMAGQLIAVVDSSNTTNSSTASHAATEQADDLVQQAQVAFNQAQDAYNRMKILHDNGSLPEIKWVEVETKLEQARLMLSQAKSNANAARATEAVARKAVADTRLVAPTAGYITEKMCDVGQNVLPGAPVVKLVQIDRVKVSVNIPENEISKVRNGQSLLVEVAALASKRFGATVVEKGVIADPLSRTYAIKAVIAKPNHELLPGMIAKVNLSGGSSSALSGLITLPASIIQIDADNRPFVWKVIEGKAQKAYVEVGQNIGDEVRIVSGLQLGDSIISQGQQKVSTWMRVTE